MTVDELIRDTRKELEYGEKPNLVLTNLYSTLFGFRRDIYGIVGKLAKDYGSHNVFNAIVNLYDSGENPRTNLYGQLLSVCRKSKSEVDKRNDEIIVMTNLNEYLMGQVD